MPHAPRGPLVQPPPSTFDSPLPARNTSTSPTSTPRPAPPSCTTSAGDKRFYEYYIRAECRPSNTQAYLNTPLALPSSTSSLPARSVTAGGLLFFRTRRVGGRRKRECDWRKDHAIAISMHAFKQTPRALAPNPLVPQQLLNNEPNPMCPHVHAPSELGHDVKVHDLAGVLHTFDELYHVTYALSPTRIAAPTALGGCDGDQRSRASGRGGSGKVGVCTRRTVQPRFNSYGVGGDCLGKDRKVSRAFFHIDYFSNLFFPSVLILYILRHPCRSSRSTMHGWTSASTASFCGGNMLAKAQWKRTPGRRERRGKLTKGHVRSGPGGDLRRSSDRREYTWETSRLARSRVSLGLGSDNLGLMAVTASGRREERRKHA
ncbi:hypothetical protein B0H34DRAFT_860597 [Crassisporium funariophilum]|nr:hypothetical protein B0H34DRAFT_860597 [Crassisporium funariophilum]